VLVEVDVTVGVSVGGGVCVGVGEGAQAAAARANDTRQMICTMRLTTMIHLLSLHEVKNRFSLGPMFKCRAPLAKTDWLSDPGLAQLVVCLVGFDYISS
jgi:hypothetical protein